MKLTKTFLILPQPAAAGLLMLSIASVGIRCCPGWRCLGWLRAVPGEVADEARRPWTIPITPAGSRCSTARR